MASIGPQLPPHLQKRKRTPEDDAEPGSPPSKTSRRGNEDEIPLDDDSDDSFGPSGPAPTSNSGVVKTPSRPRPTIGPSLPPTVANHNTPAPASKKQPIGPSLPPAIKPANNDEIALDSDSDDAPNPAPPRTTSGPALPPKRVLGPAPPPAPFSERPTTNPDPDPDSDSDDDWGPALPGAAPTSRGNTGPALPSTSHPEPAAPKRDDWMLAPPTSSGPRTQDPTKIKARKFASGPRAATEAKQSGISSIWTETPEEKARRLANAVLGREDPNNPATQPGNGGGGGGGGARPEAPGASGGGGNSKADEARIKSYIEQTRGKSMVEQHQAAKTAGRAATLAKDNTKWGQKGGGESGGAEDEDDDPSKRAFDWEKDMKVGGRITNSQRKEMMNRAADFGGRFQSGKYL